MSLSGRKEGGERQFDADQAVSVETAGGELVRIGRLKQTSRGASQHCTSKLIADPSSKKAMALTWAKVLVDGAMDAHPGVYCMGTNELTWDEAKLWRTLG